ncbi:MAG: dihydrofolate reductase [Clostridia bacterium]|nr:dihydrofolate reductase [Clostridia bacterium]
MKLIVAVSENWGIGKDNGLLFSIPTDMKFFRETTKGHTVVMGRKTLESFPGGKPLKNRLNIVLSKNLPEGEGYTVVRGPEELLETLKSVDGEVFIIGGESVYRLLLPYADTALVTKVSASVPADSFMPDLDKDAQWRLESKSEPVFENGLEFSFCTYKRVLGE